MKRIDKDTFLADLRDSDNLVAVTEKQLRELLIQINRYELLVKRMAADLEAMDRRLARYAEMANMDIIDLRA